MNSAIYCWKYPSNESSRVPNKNGNISNILMDVWIKRAFQLCDPASINGTNLHVYLTNAYAVYIKNDEVKYLIF